MAKREIERSPFGQRLFDSRAASGLTQEAAAKLIGIRQSSLAELEKKGQGSSRVVVMALIYQRSPTWLATGEGTPEAGKPPPRPPRDFSDPAPGDDSGFAQLARDLPFIPPDERRKLIASIRERAEEQRKHLKAMLAERLKRKDVPP